MNIFDRIFRPVERLHCRMFEHFWSPFQRTCVRCGKDLGSPSNLGTPRKDTR